MGWEVDLYLLRNNTAEDCALVEHQGKLYCVPWRDITVTGTQIIEDPKKAARAEAKPLKEAADSIEERARRLEDEAEGDDHAQ